MLQGNVKKCQEKYIRCIYDLKGSDVNRDVKGDKHKNTAVLKDLNLCRLIKQEDDLLLFDLEKKDDLMKQMAIDISFLSYFGLMDYSLLLTIEYNPSYVELYQEQFITNRNGKIKFPLVPKKVDENAHHKLHHKTNLVKNNEKMSKQFMKLIAGMNSKKFEMKFIDHKLTSIGNMEKDEKERRETNKYKVSFKGLDMKKMLLNDQQVHDFEAR